MKIRETVPSDADAVREVHTRSIRGLGPEAYSQRQVDAWAQGLETAGYRERIADEQTVFLVAERDGTVVGFATLVFATPEEYEANPDAEVTAVYVHPDVSRQGVGTELYTALEQRARTRGVETLGLWASRNAVPFYESQGYERVTEHEHEFSSHESTGVTGTVVEMRKEL